MCDTYSSLETLEVGGEDGVRHPRFPTNPLHHLHLVCHLDKGDRNQLVLENKPPPFLHTAVSVPPYVGCVSTFHMNGCGRTNSPVEPILETQSWWPQ